MRRIMGILISTTAAISAVIAVPAEASAPTVIHVRTVGAAVFLDPTPRCEVARATAHLRQEAQPAGRLRVCYQTFIPGDDFQVFEGPAAVRLRAGTVYADTVNVEVPVADNKVTSTFAGQITGGTGAFRGASGSVSGAGTILFGPRNAFPSIALELRLD